MMNKTLIALTAAALAVVAVPAVASAHCGDQATGALAGAAIGAAIGNSSSHHYNRGANTAVGALAGAAIGAAVTSDSCDDGYYRDGYSYRDRSYGYNGGGYYYARPRTYYYAEPRGYYRYDHRDYRGHDHGDRGHHRGRW